MKHFVVTTLTILFAIVCIPFAVNAQDKDKTFKKWTVYTVKLQGTKTCYMASFPTSKTGNYRRRDEPYFLVTRLKDGSDEVSVSSGYRYKKKSDARATIDGKKYRMFTDGELAWAYDGKDKPMVAAMKKGNTMSVRGTSTLGTYSVDKYSLSGFTAAHKRMHQLCK